MALLLFRVMMITTVIFWMMLKKKINDKYGKEVMTKQNIL